MSLILYRRGASPALFVFIAGYFSTQIPLAAGSNILLEDRLALQCLTNLATIIGYAHLVPDNKRIQFAACNEVLMMLINIAWLSNMFYAASGMMSPWHYWYHWALFAIINYISLGVLLYNHGLFLYERGTGPHTDPSNPDSDGFMARYFHPVKKGKA